MTHFGERLREDRKRSGLTQEELAQKVEVSDKSLSASYISKMETGLLPPPSRKAAVGLAEALGMPDKPLTLYVSTKDIAALRRFTFFLEANVAGAEDVQEIKPINVDDSEAEGEKQESGATTYRVAHPSVKLPTRFVGARAEEIEHLIASGGYSEEEEEEVWGAVIEVIKRFNSLQEMQRRTRKEDKR